MARDCDSYRIRMVSAVTGMKEIRILPTMALSWHLTKTSTAADGITSMIVNPVMAGMKYFGIEIKLVSEYIDQKAVAFVHPI